MRDRIPGEGKAGRVLLTPENGDAPFYATMEMADDPTDIGTPPTKANLLTDATEVSLFGDAADRTVNQAFAGIAGKLRLIMSDMATMKLTVKGADGVPLSGIVVSGVFDDSGNDVVTNDFGIAEGYVASGTTTIAVSGYADIVDYSETVSIVKGNSYTKEIAVTRRNFLKLTSSQSVKFSKNVERLDVTAVGGGGSGGGSTTYAHKSAGGGGGGYCVVQENVSFEPDTFYPAVIGSGGAAVTKTVGKEGGKTSFLGVEASGGKGGTIGGGTSDPSSGGAGNGRGGYGYHSGAATVADVEDAVEGSVAGFSSFTETVLYGGGGSGSANGANLGGYYEKIFSEKAGYGGKNAAGTNGFGGGGSANDGTSYKGGSGCIAIRMHLTAA